MKTATGLVAFYERACPAAPNSQLLNLGIGLMPGDGLKDQEGVETFKTLGRNMARLLKQIC